MHTHSIDQWRHAHVFLGEHQEKRERRLWLVVALTFVTMVIEIVAGYLFGSMALTADGWHMSTHAAALAISALGYRFARRHAHDPKFSFGTGKLSELAAFGSATVLALIALLIGFESAVRLLTPVAIRFDEAILVAIIGLAVNLASAWLLTGGHGHRDEHGHDHHPGHVYDHDTNYRAAFLHVLADALTSILAIAALLAGRLYGWLWLDPVIGIVGALVIARWAWGLLGSAGAVLLDVVPDQRLAGTVRSRLEVDGDRVADLHLWRLGPGHIGLIATVVSGNPKEPSAYKERLADIGGLSHLTIEVHRCSGQTGA